MVAKGYSTYQKVETELGGITFTAGQQTAANERIEVAENRLDAWLGRAWIVASPVIAETHRVYGDRVYLKRRPVTAVTAVTVRSEVVGDTATAGVALTDFELLDAANGVLLLGYRDGAYVSVAYTHSTALAASVPAEVVLATTKYAALLMGNVLNSGLTALQGQVRQLAVGRYDLAVTFREAPEDGGIPEEIRALVSHLRRPVFA